MKGGVRKKIIYQKPIQKGGDREKDLSKGEERSIYREW